MNSAPTVAVLEDQRFAASTSPVQAVTAGPRRIAFRTSGSQHGPITRLVSPSDVGALIKPFVFLDHFEIVPRPEPLFGIHPHSGIATLTVVLRGGLAYEDTTGKTGTVAKGGLDLGPAGGEYLLVSLGGCFTSHLLAAIRAREAAVTNVRVVVTGTLAGTPERFAGFTMDVSAESQDSELARKLITIAARACQVVNTLRQVAPVAITYEGLPVPLSIPDADDWAARRRSDATSASTRAEPKRD